MAGREWTSCLFGDHEADAGSSSERGNCLGLVEHLGLPTHVKSLEHSHLSSEISFDN